MQLFELLLEERAIAHAPPSASAKSQMRLPELKPAMSELSKACVDDTLVSPEPVWSKSAIARRTRRYKIAGLREVRREKVSLRRLAGSAAQAAMRSTVDKESRLEILQRLESTSGVPEVISVSPCVSNCHSSASRTAQKFEERLFQRHQILRGSGSRNVTKIVDMQNKKQRGRGPNIPLVVGREIDCMKCIILREIYLGTVCRILEKLKTLYSELDRIQDTVCGGDSDEASSLASVVDDTAEKKMWRSVQFNTGELVVLLDQLRLISLDLVEKARDWRETRRITASSVTAGDNPSRMESHLIGLMYQGDNYLVKMMSDLAFLDDSPAAQHYFDTFSYIDNPFMMPIDDEILEDRCLEAAKHLCSEAKCAALVAKTSLLSSETLRGTMTQLPSLKLMNPAPLINRARVPISQNTHAGILKEQKPSCSKAQMLHTSCVEAKVLHRTVRPIELPAHHGAPPVLGSPRSEKPDFGRLRRRIRDRIEPKQHVKLEPVLGLPGRALVGVPITNLFMSNVPEECAFEFSIQRTAVLIQRIIRGSLCRNHRDESQSETSFLASLHQPALMIQACFRRNAVQYWKRCHTAFLHRKVKFIRKFFATTTCKRMKSHALTIHPDAITITHEPLFIRSTNAKAVVQEAGPRAAKELDADFVLKEISAKKIQRITHASIDQKPVRSIEAKTHTAERSAAVIQAHVRGSHARKRTDLSQLASASNARRQSRFDDAVSAALEAALAIESSGDGSHMKP